MVLDLNEWEYLCICFCGPRSNPIRAHCFNGFTPHGSQFHPQIIGMVVVAGNVIRQFQAGLRESYECLASVPISPWLTAKKESGSPLQTALVCNSNPLMVARLPKPGCCGRIVLAKTGTLLYHLLLLSLLVAAGYLVSAGTCFCCYSILLLREDLSRNLELTESKPSLGEDCWDKLKTTKCRFPCC
ncbi:hypothetical protein Tco_0833415 [Tanacetum coccineum]